VPNKNKYYVNFLIVTGMLVILQGCSAAPVVSSTPDITKDLLIQQQNQRITELESQIEELKYENEGMKKSSSESSSKTDAILHAQDSLGVFLNSAQMISKYYPVYLQTDPKKVAILKSIDFNNPQLRGEDEFVIYAELYDDLPDPQNHQYGSCIVYKHTTEMDKIYGIKTVRFSLVNQNGKWVLDTVNKSPW